MQIELLLRRKLTLYVAGGRHLGHRWGMVDEVLLGGWQSVSEAIHDCVACLGTIPCSGTHVHLDTRTERSVCQCLDFTVLSITQSPQDKQMLQSHSHLRTNKYHLKYKCSKYIWVNKGHQIISKKTKPGSQFQTQHSWTFNNW